VVGDLPHPGRGSDAQPAIAQFDAVEGQFVDVHDQVGSEDAVLHQVRQLGPARDERGFGPGGDQIGGFGRTCGARVLERPHRPAPFAASRTASTMFG
jgi:hypothetical protein